MGSSISVNRDNFATEVMEKSYEKPVLVDFFAQWCGPCQMLKPMLEKLAQEYDFVLAKVDIDQNPELANAYGIEGVPDVRIVVDGTMTEGFVGVLPEPQLKELLAQLNLKSTLEEGLESVYNQASQGKLEQAQALLSDLLQQYPDDRSLKLEAANFYIETDQLEAAEALLQSISEYDKEYAPHVKTLKALIQFKCMALQSAGDNDSDQAFQTVAHLVLDEKHEDALSLLLDLLNRDRRYRDSARKLMLAIFDLLGDSHPLTKEYRKRLTMALY